MNLLTLDHISLSFKGIKAITDISFSVRRGSVCSLIGPNGAGKTSLLNVINGIYRPEGGRLIWEGEECPFMKPEEAARLGIARSFQNLALFRRMSVRDNVLTGRTLHVRSQWWQQALRLPSAQHDALRQQRKAEAILKFLQLQRWRDVPVGQLPYGLQKRVELGRALASEPKLLLLDEPMAGMNAEEKSQLSGFIRAINQEYGTTIVLIEHDLGVVMDLSDHLVVLDYGRKIGDGRPEDVQNLPEVVAAYTGTRYEKEASA